MFQIIKPFKDKKDLLKRIKQFFEETEYLTTKERTIEVITVHHLCYHLGIDIDELHLYVDQYPEIKKAVEYVKLRMFRNEITDKGFTKWYYETFLKDTNSGTETQDSGTGVTINIIQDNTPGYEMEEF